jgi:hypothetical protein
MADTTGVLRRMCGLWKFGYTFEHALQAAFVNLLKELIAVELLPLERRLRLMSWPFRMEISLLSVCAELEQTESNVSRRRETVLQKRKSNKYEN